LAEQLRHAVQQVQAALGDVLKRENPNIANAQRTYADITRDTIDPLMAEPVGVVAGRAGFDPAAPSPVPRITGAVANAGIARPDTIRTLYTQLNAQDPARSLASLVTGCKTNLLMLTATSLWRAVSEVGGSSNS